MIVVIDYGMGNLHSVRKALEISGGRVKVSSLPSDIKKADKIVFPGVGSFGAAMKELRRRKLVMPIKDAIAAGKPFLGLCLGLQLLFERSEEAPGVRGLCVLKGEVKRFKFAKRRSFERSSSSRSQDQICFANLKVPHMGWNRVSKCQSIKVSKIMKDIPQGSYMYFVHSYYVKPKDKRNILATTGYGINFTSGVCKDNVYAFQFHPEKSQELGLRILRNFVKL